LTDLPDQCKTASSTPGANILYTYASIHLDISLMHRIYQLGSPIVSLSISCSSENCGNALKEDGIEITIVHNIQVCD